MFEKHYEKNVKLPSDQHMHQLYNDYVFIRCWTLYVCCWVTDTLATLHKIVERWWKLQNV